MSDKINSSEKNEAWRNVVVGFNCKNGSYRNLDQLKIKYDNLKCKTTKVMAANKQYVMGTGGGQAADTKLDPVVEYMLRITNKITVVGHGSDCDDSTDNYIDNEPSNVTYLVEVESEENVLLSEEEVVAIASIEIDMDSRQLQLCDQGKKTSWDKYTPRKLKTPMSRRLRQTVKSPLKDMLYKKKIELPDEEIKKSRLEQEAITAKETRNVEVHEKKIRLMDLEVELKEKMLNEK